MQRHAFAIEVKEGKTAEFRSNLGKIWKELTAFLDDKKMVNFSMWNVEKMVQMNLLEKQIHIINMLASKKGLLLQRRFRKWKKQSIKIFVMQF